ncbi:uncharacterized protein LOC106155359 isoform X2 [Lingula anatina]|nr:uncharacterized protein LOC106155359 isoform X2 [Lingula anatina]|eukprot:XP_013385608.1 uncharacterized protein LOC106155359 isoform X2 [Lingula anatina]
MMKTCCFCWNLKQGSIASGIWTLVLAVLECLVTIYRTVLALMIGDKSLQTMEYVVLIIGSILWLFWIVSSVLTIVGAVQVSLEIDLQIFFLSFFMYRHRFLCTHSRHLHLLSQ